MIIKYGNSNVHVYLRKDGRWALRWKEAGKGRATTLKGKKEEAELLTPLLSICGQLKKTPTNY